MDLSKATDDELRLEAIKRGFAISKPVTIRFTADDIEDIEG